MQRALQKTETFASVLREWMSAREMTPDAAATRLGVSHQTVRNWIAGGLPTRPRIPALARALRIPEDDLRKLVVGARHATKGSNESNEPQAAVLDAEVRP